MNFLGFVAPRPEKFVQLSEFCDLSHSELKFLSFAYFSPSQSKISDFFCDVSLGPNQKRTKKKPKKLKTPKKTRREPGRTGQEPGKNRGTILEKKWPKLAIFRKKKKQEF